ncbi:hypothetical protein V6N13_091536 [Hibiscus sabdariffa]|uniref:Uncharacterized protein n=1 Tax=Hibiscus sabdariffa TaxID=183260 RepID=A0ABR2QE55_9ROSI
MGNRSKGDNRSVRSEKCGSKKADQASLRRAFRRRSRPKAVYRWILDPADRDVGLAHVELWESSDEHPVLVELSCTRSSEELLSIRRAYHARYKPLTSASTNNAMESGAIPQGTRALTIWVAVATSRNDRSPCLYHHHQNFHCIR